MLFVHFITCVRLCKGLHSVLSVCQCSERCWNEHIQLPCGNNMATKDKNICIPDRDQSSSLLRISTTFGIAYHFEMVETGHMTASKCSLVPRPSITANAVEGLAKLQHRMTSGGHLEAWHLRWTAILVYARRVGHASRCPPDIILCWSFARPSTALAVIEGLGTRLTKYYIEQS